MTPGMKMMMLARRSGNGTRGGGGSQGGNRGGARNANNAYNGGNQGGSMEMNGGQYRMDSDKGWVVKPIDRIGGGRYRMEDEPSNRYETQMNEMEMEVESRFRDRRGRDHYNNGRYAPMRSAYDGGPMGEYNEGRMGGYVPPIHEVSTGYRYDGGGNRMIGFGGGGEMQNNYRMDATHHNRDEMEHRTSAKKPGYSSSDVEPMTREKAQQWVRKMKNADGSTGEHWTYDQTTQVMKQRNIDCEPAEFYAVMNMLWSDYGKVAEKFGVSNLEYWAELSKAFLMDKDAMEDKLALYYECVVKK